MTHALIHEEVARRAADRPDATAVVHRGAGIDYRTLDAAADACAAELAGLGAGPGAVVPVNLPRSPHMFAALLAILKCGAAYVAFDRRWPAERVDALTGLLDPPLLVTADQDGPGPDPGPEPGPTGRIPRWNPATRTLEDWAARAAAGARPPRPDVAPTDPATVFFTSGTTGLPKGVISPHRATTRLFAPSGPLAFGPGHVMCQAAPAPWDAFTLELWGMLTTGGCVVVAEDDHLLPHVLQRLVVEHGVNTAWLTASLFNLFLDVDPECFAGLHRVFTGGERLSGEHVRAFLARHPRIALVNGYGPVESCVFATCHQVGPADIDDQDGIPLGRPVPHTGVHIVDGEICLSGAGLALGYLGDERLTAAKFVDLPVGAGVRRVYRTGDLGSVDDAGVLHFHGRTDRQVKIRGHRIEPAEIEAAAGQLDGIGQCVVVPVPGAQPGVYDKLALLYTAIGRIEAAGGDPLGVRRRLAGRLPRYAIPDTVRVVDAIPVTANGKADRQALLALSLG